MKYKKQGHDWLFKVTFTLPGNESSVEGDKVYFLMKTSASVADASASVNVSVSLTDSEHLSGTTVTVYVPVPKATTAAVTPADYVAMAYWEVAGTPTKWFQIGDDLYITVVDSIKDVPT